MSYYICETCGKDYSEDIADLNSDCFNGNNCFICSFWMEKVELAENNDGKSVIVNGDHYRIGSVCPDIGRGHAGNFWAIEFDTGLIIGTRNLWAQGTIDKHFVNKLPNNAKFLTKIGKTSEKLLREGWYIKHLPSGEYQCYGPGDNTPSKVFKDGKWY